MASSDPPTQQPGSGEVCPVDHTTRAAWLEAAKKQNGTGNTPPPPAPAPAPPATLPSAGTTHPPPSPTSTTATCDSSTMHLSATLPPSALPPSLSPHREISTIPRSSSPTSSSTPNNETPDPHTSPSGHWVYPSEQMFFAAMRRKSWDPQAADMAHIVPIHNAVNERAWTEIKKWEAGRGGERCGGPRLVRFAGDSKKMTPKARVMVLLGYQRPFDRHDWTVDRCGKNVDYVIDFYSGKRDPARPEAVSFYLDVRPKVNSVEGVMMRVSSFFGGLFSS